MQKSNTQPLDIHQIKRLLASNEVAKKEKEQQQSRYTTTFWPGSYNMTLLAEAANRRKIYVEFEGGKQFSIRYDDKRKWLFVSPVNSKSFVPCGYFSYQQLKEAMPDE